MDSDWKTNSPCLFDFGVVLMRRDSTENHKCFGMFIWEFSWKQQLQALLWVTTEPAQLEAFRTLWSREIERTCLEKALCTRQYSMPFTSLTIKLTRSHLKNFKSFRNVFLFFQKLPLNFLVKILPALFSQVLPPSPLFSLTMKAALVPMLRSCRCLVTCALWWMFILWVHSSYLPQPLRHHCCES